MKTSNSWCILFHCLFCDVLYLLFYYNLCGTICFNTCFPLSSYSEFFNKGPRPRRKDQEQDTTAAGLELVDTMANHLQSGAPLAVPDSDSRSVTSIDRSPPNSVRPLVACLRNARFPLACFHCCHVPGRKESLNDDSPSFTGHRSFQHDLVNSDVSYLPNKNLHDALYCCDDTVDACNTTCSATDRELLQVQIKSLARDNGMGHQGVGSSAPQVNPVPKPMRGDVDFGPPGYQETSNVQLSNGASHVSNSSKAADEGTANRENTVREKEAPSYLPETSGHPNTHVVYLNRTPSEGSVGHTQDKRDSFVEMLDSLLERKLNVSDVGVTLEDEIEASESDKLLKPTGGQTDQVLIKGKDVIQKNSKKSAGPEQNPMIKKQKLQVGRPRPPKLVQLKSYSFEQAERSYDSDDSIGNACSLVSQSSTLSRLSKLSVTTCPPIRIDPTEAKSLGLKDSRGKHPLFIKGTASLPARKPNTSYTVFSSFDTETSEGGSSSNDSLSENRCAATVPDVGSRHRVSGGDRSPRNVAIGSLKTRGSSKDRVKSDEDSGRESWPKETNGSLKHGELESVILMEEVDDMDVDGDKCLHSTPRSVNGHNDENKLVVPSFFQEFE